MIEVELARPRSGCLVGLLNLCTWGLFGRLSRATELRQIVCMDEHGFETLGGRRYCWGEIRRVHRTVRTLLGAKVYETIDVYVDRGFVTLPCGQAANAEEVLDFFVRHAPART